MVTLVTIVTSNGTIKRGEEQHEHGALEREVEERERVPGEHRGDHLTDVMTMVTMRLFFRYSPMCPAFHASRYAPHCGSVGKNFGGCVVISTGRSSEFTTVM